MPCTTRDVVTKDVLTAHLDDGRRISVPLVWYRRLVHATADERDNCELHTDNQHISWPNLDEDISVEGLLARRRSQEIRALLNRWLVAKKLATV